ncbi:hypothetical protein LTS18_008848 [Coniosporium uncinatum]|uniref:Uncharacterized protein n=1 Tax=Coniosporium uncinatum TaxID=93489 RepID=A0ACC3DWZ3_9PEZI|nr:hypothetical protein LTS18_008848 [Coniosporium uncinatum]
MGNDGGRQVVVASQNLLLQVLTHPYSIPTRRELVKEAARNPTTAELKETRQEQQEYLWSTDPISRRPLTRPIVSDSAGKLYNKDTIIEHLLPSEDDRSKAEAEKILQGAVKSLRDVVEVQFEVDASDTSSKKETWVCPITNKTIGPGAKAVYLVPCGHAFAGAAVKEVSGEKCLQCNEPYASNDVIPILPTEETDIARLSLRAQTLKEKGLTHSLKKAPGSSKKRKKNADVEEKQANGVATVVKLKGTANNSDDSEAPKLVPTSKVSDSGIKNASTASLTVKVLQEQEARNKKRKLAGNNNLNSLYSSRDPTKPMAKNSDYMSRGFYIPAHQKR